MPPATNTPLLAIYLPARTRWLLLAITLVWLVGCAIPSARKSSPRDPLVHGEKFSCGEACPKGRTL